MTLSAGDINKMVVLFMSKTKFCPGSRKFKQESERIREILESAMMEEIIKKIKQSVEEE